MDRVFYANLRPPPIRIAVAPVCKRIPALANIVETKQEAALLVANRRLHALRAAYRAARVEVAQQDAVPPGAVAETTVHANSAALSARVAALPAHLGWGSEAVTAVVRAAMSRSCPPAASAGSPQLMATPVPSPAIATSPERPTVKVYPSLALGMLREKLVAAGRLWLLLRHLDAMGQGCLRIASIKNRLTTKAAPLRLCGWRQLRKLLGQGENIFWTRDRERVWLRSPAKTAVALGVVRLEGWPVALPVAVLLQPIGTVRAHFYASFHAGRTRGETAKPIARETLTRLSGVARRSQRTYEARLGLPVQHNIAVGEVATPARTQQRGWERGRALFHFYDGAGKLGVAGRTYLAWQLPNSYGRCHRLARRGRQKRINRELTDLFAKGMTGNDQLSIERRYFANGRQASTAAQDTTAYWPMGEQVRSGGVLWGAF